jgi:hypothetical protein
MVEKSKSGTSSSSSSSKGNPILDLLKPTAKSLDKDYLEPLLAEAKKERNGTARKAVENVLALSKKLASPRYTLDKNPKEYLEIGIEYADAMSNLDKDHPKLTAKLYAALDAQPKRKDHKTFDYLGKQLHVLVENLERDVARRERENPAAEEAKKPMPTTPMKGAMLGVPQEALEAARGLSGLAFSDVSAGDKAPSTLAAPPPASKRGLS